MSFMPCVSLCKLLTTSVIMYQFSIKNNMFIITPCSLLLLPISKHISAVFVFDAIFKCFVSVTFHKLHLLFPLLSLKKQIDPFVLKPAFKDSIIGIFIFMRHMHLFPENLISVMSDCCLLMSLTHILHVLLRMLFLALHFSSVKWFCCCITKCLLAKIPDMCLIHLLLHFMSIVSERSQVKIQNQTTERDKMLIWMIIVWSTHFI